MAWQRRDQRRTCAVTARKDVFELPTQANNANIGLRLSRECLDALEANLTPTRWQKFWDTCGKTAGAGFAALDAITGEDVTEARKYEGAAAPRRDDEAKGGKMDLSSRDGKIVGIARGEMREQFMVGCEDFIRWSHHVAGYELTDSGVRAIFADGSKSEEGEMLVGGEGIYSKVAKQVSNGKIVTYDTGARGIHGKVSTSAFKELGEGVWRVTDERKKDGKVFLITNVRANDMDDPTVEFGWVCSSSTFAKSTSVPGATQGLDQSAAPLQMARILDHGPHSTHVFAAHHLMAPTSTWLTCS